MKRFQLFELHELSWFPKPLRELQTEILDYSHRYTKFAEVLAPIFSQLLEETGASTVLDLCSGAAGPIVQIVESIDGEGGTAPKLLLSDLYPSIDSWSALKESYPEWLDYVEEPVDATKIPDHLEGDVVSIVNALHHFPPETAREVIAAAVRRGSSIFIAEGFPRSIPRATSYLPSLVRSIPEALANTKSQRAAKVALALSALPWTGVWDWLVSALRIHDPKELMTDTIAPNYLWSHGEVPFPPWGRALYIVGLSEEHS